MARPSRFAKMLAAKAEAVADPRAAAATAGSWRARAKINLYLHITGRRADGYHCLDSLVVFADLGDEIEVEANDGLRFSIAGPFAPGLPTDESNLVWQAATALSRAAGIKARASIRLRKNLPVAAGLGGGSADAAAALLALRALWHLPMDDRALHELAAGLGADVPVCLSTRPSLISGIGHDVIPAPPLPPFALVLVNPMQALSTAAVFKQVKQPIKSSQPWRETPDKGQSLAQCLDLRRNDLEPAARHLAPVVGEVITTLENLPGCCLARMSGSGATCFGVFDDLARAEAAADILTGARTDWWVRACAVVGATEGFER